ncbi:MAG: ArnT family glycosyltransferase, partial [Vicinamibacterales bacterium]
MSPAWPSGTPKVDARSPGPPSRGQLVNWLASTLGLSAVYIAATIPNLARYPHLSGDDSWVMSASHKLATTGVFGSDLYAGFHGADVRYFIALPVYHALQALSFVTFGSGIAQARGVTVASAVVVLWAATWLSLRWHGPRAAILSGLLLLFWRVDLVEIAPGLPMLAVGRTGRYDMTAVALLWLTVVCLDATFRRAPERSRWTASLTGLCAGLATLTQFFGAFSVLIVASPLLWRAGRRRLIGQAGVWIAAGFALVVLPYAAFVVRHWSDFVGQSALKAGRGDFDRPSFYVDNLGDEAERYQRLITSPAGVGGWLFIAAFVPALGWLIWRCRRRTDFGDRLLLAALIAPAVALAFVDDTNVGLYTIVLWPGCCLAVAIALVSAFGWLRRRLTPRHATAQTVLTVGLAAALVAGLAFAIVDGVAAYRDDRRQAARVTDYGDVANRLDGLL